MIFYPNPLWDNMIYDSDGSNITYKHNATGHVWMSNKYCFYMSMGRHQTAHFDFGNKKYKVTHGTTVFGMWDQNDKTIKLWLTQT